MEEHTCIIDFAGNYSQCGVWCDYFPQRKAVKFGGAWSDIPNMPVDHEPEEEECYAWIKKHKEFDYSKLDKLTVEIIVDDNPNNPEEVSRLLKKALEEKLNETAEKIQG